MVIIYFFVLFLFSLPNKYIVCVSINNLNTKILTTESSINNYNNSVVYKKSRSTEKCEKFLVNSTNKRQINKNNQRKYEIIDLLWEKTTVFLEGTTNYYNTTDTCTSRNKKSDRDRNKIFFFVQNPMQSLPQIPKPRMNSQTSTESYIEFYYFNEMNLNPNILMPTEISKKWTYGKHTKLKHNKSYKPHLFLQKKEIPDVKTTSSFLIPLIEKVATIQHRDKYSKTSKASYKIEVTTPKKIFTPSTQKNYDYIVYNPESTIRSLEKNNFNNNNKTTVYDRVKFFDIYDSDTYNPYLVMTTNRNIFEHRRNQLNTDSHLLIENPNVEIPTHTNKTRFAKKHISNLKYNKSSNNSNKNNPLTKSSNKASEINFRSQFTLAKEHNSRLVNWSDHTFVAAYIYEPTQVYCDAATISPHWLIAAAVCLYRHHKNPSSDERSAFVVYCSDNWKRPVLISYVKRSIIHPRFHPTDIYRRHLYNIGAIQVVNSMSESCYRWSPISLISHQFSPECEGTMASTLGWGLDRFYISYPNEDRYNEGHLMMYKNLIYPSRCSGNAQYSKIKNIDPEIAKNIYCIPLPRSSLHLKDPVHGGLLLIGGKLIALFLEEERRFLEEWSAVYTSIWKLLPWLNEVAREPENQDFLLEF